MLTATMEYDSSFQMFNFLQMLWYLIDIHRIISWINNNELDYLSFLSGLKSKTIFYEVMLGFVGAAQRLL
ncbi:unnamed protein product [Schistosoma margrebowiei]|uniref:Uncharacterized protein n=1 Tax=Schistosoma margrebowiei TaxID=48269 RepID=A0AA85AMT9_9TREM|nr:unnamed protein product [Schistosoma margrebowiei]